ncbi:hypothetical protein Y032_0354g3313 [Ancylostoma ceylanicum]|uniref:Uncharacterized protein n=1 Tax=Ancylostoma ceylanicum TaxID=53326 RepID=A0A016RWK2_9BILA|nr:hypothetical protein Y032_0354g3313 [Ancylostoma ceylanicum]
MHGSVSSADDNLIVMDTDKYHTEMCLVRAGPSSVDRYEYLVLAEASGKNACRSYHVFARNTDEFNRRYFDDVSDFMKKLQIDWNENFRHFLLFGFNIGSSAAQKAANISNI